MKSADDERPGRPFSTRAEGPSRRAAQQRKELSSPHSITSSGSEQCMPSPIAAKRKKEVSDPAAPQADDPECFLRLPKVPSEMSTDGTTQTSRSWLAMSVNGGESGQGDPALESTRLTRSGQRLSQAL